MGRKMSSTESAWGLLERRLLEADEPGGPQQTVYSGRRLTYNELTKLAGHYGTKGPDPDGGTLQVKPPDDAHEDWKPDISTKIWPDRFVPDPARAVQHAVSSAKGTDARAGAVRTYAQVRKAGGFRAPPGAPAVDKGEPIRAKSHTSDQGYSPDAGDVSSISAPNPRTGRDEPIKRSMRVREPALPYGMRAVGDPNKGPQRAQNDKGRPVGLNNAPVRSESLYDVVVAGTQAGPDVVIPFAMVWLPVARSVSGGASVDTRGGAVELGEDEQEMRLLDMLAGIGRNRPQGVMGPSRGTRAQNAPKPELDKSRRGQGYMPPERKQRSFKVPTQEVPQWSADDAEELFPDLPSRSRFGRGPKEK